MIISLAGQKGGIGKTTTSISLAAYWHSQGHRVLLVDADPQGSARTWADVALEAGLATPTVVSMGAGLHRPDQLPELAQNYDITVLDCPPRHGAILRAALVVSELVVLPCGPSPLDVWAIGKTLDLVEEVRTIQPALHAVVLMAQTLTHARSTQNSEIRAALSSCGLPVLESELASRVAYQRALAAGLGVTEYAPRSRAAQEVRQLAAELETVVVTKEIAHAA